MTSDNKNVIIRPPAAVTNQTERPRPWEIEESISAKFGRRQKDLMPDRRKGLCFSCTHATIFQRKTQNDPTIQCSEVHGRLGDNMPHDIVSCSDYNRVTDMSLQRMIEMATLIDVRDKGGHYL